MPTIRVSDDSLKRLKAWAEPLEDSADSALRKALDAAERVRADSRRGVRELSEEGSAFAAAGSADAPRGFVDHLLAIPDVGEDSDFDRPRSGPRRVEP